MAKLTHKIYGTKSHAAGLDILAKAIIVVRIASQRKTISMSAPPGLCRPKKIIDQRVFKTSCTRNIPRAIFTSLDSNPFFHTKNAATPMRTNNVVQTGPNNHAGGFIGGFTIPEYQPAIDEVVKIDPIIPASSETAIAMMSLNVLFIFIVFFISIPT